ncbi:hypothetical protein B7P43_G00933 [Cryptotermes secundus]|uniref:Endonuclease/exonuclease/phosphatase domain-containing protein n=1 Tax=Cryptotermes secundus TaxID=105785 RepID=A0A2J7PG68_9NEOP|nr:hypothetical protein B7P43_G00933 [Cryptotermes secundus]
MNHLSLKLQGENNLVCDLFALIKAFRAKLILLERQVKNLFICYTSNVRTLNQAGKLDNLETEMEKNEVSVLGVSKVRWKGQGEIRSGDYTVYYSGGERAERGVAIVVHKSVVRSVVKKIACNDRIIALKLKAEPVDILIIQVYMPTSEYEDDEVEKVYDTIEEILQEDGRGDTNSIILGDWNSIVGDEPYQNIVGSHGLGRRNHRELGNGSCRLAEKTGPLERNAYDVMIVLRAQSPMRCDPALGPLPIAVKLYADKQDVLFAALRR